MLSLYTRVPQTLWRAGFYSCLVAVFVLALGSSNVQVISTGWDKANHVLAFSVLAFLLIHAHHLGRSKAFALLIVIGAVIEVLQSFTPNRYAEWYDLIADGLGAVLGISIAMATKSLALRFNRARNPIADQP